jgi:hypothetical protein
MQNEWQRDSLFEKRRWLFENPDCAATFAPFIERSLMTEIRKKGQLVVKK